MQVVMRRIARGMRSVLGVNGLADTVASNRGEIGRIAASVEQLGAALGDFTGLRTDVDLVRGELAQLNSALKLKEQFRSEDIICKYHNFPGSQGWMIALPAVSADPVVNLYKCGVWENADIITMMMQMTSPGDCVVDLGAHVGTFCIGAAALGRHVTAVDASPRHIRLLRMSKAVNDLEHLIITESAISEVPGELRFSENGLFGAVDFHGNEKNTIAVAASRLDDIIDANVDGPIRFLKMDVEGSELTAVRSGHRMIERDKPVIWFESNPPTFANAGFTVRDFRMTLENWGYKTFRIEGERWIYAPPEQLQPEAWVDMMALSEIDQHRYAEHIEWHWPPEAMLEKCRKWAALPFANAKQHLAAEIEAHMAEEPLKAPLAGILRELIR